MHSPLKIRIARPSNTGAIVELFNKVYEGGYPASELQSADALSEVIGKRAEIYHIAVVGERVVGCVATRIVRATVEPETGTHVAEVGKLCTDPEIADRSGVARRLCRAAMRASERCGARTLYGTVRSGAALNIVRSLGFHPVGYTAEHTVGGVREAHVIVLRMSDSARRQRVAPENATSPQSIYRTSLVRSVMEGLRLEAAQASAYPCTTFVVEPNLPGVERAYFQVISSERRLRLAAFPSSSATYVDAIIAADKSELIATLHLWGLRLTAFLPGWYQLRYDAVLLSATGDQLRTDASILGHVQRFQSLGQEVHHD